MSEKENTLTVEELLEIDRRPATHGWFAIGVDEWSRVRAAARKGIEAEARLRQAAQQHVSPPSIGKEAEGMHDPACSSTMDGRCDCGADESQFVEPSPEKESGQNKLGESSPIKPSPSSNQEHPGLSEVESIIQRLTVHDVDGNLYGYQRNLMQKAADLLFEQRELLAKISRERDEAEAGYVRIAEKAGEVVQSLHDQIDSLRDEAQAENERLREALSFYAQRHYLRTPEIAPLDAEDGSVARAALNHQNGEG